MSWNLEADHLIKMIWAICKSSLHHWSIITAVPIQTEAAPQKKTMKHLKDSHTVRSKVLWPDGTKAELLTLILNLFGGNHPQHSGAQPGPKILHQEDDHKNTRKVCAQNVLTSLLHNRNKWETFPWVTTDPETRWAEMTVHSKLGLSFLCIGPPHVSCLCYTTSSSLLCPFCPFSSTFAESECLNSSCNVEENEWLNPDKKIQLTN